MEVSVSDGRPLCFCWVLHASSTNRRMLINPVKLQCISQQWLAYLANPLVIDTLHPSLKEHLLTIFCEANASNDLIDTISSTFDKTVGRRENHFSKHL